MTDKPRARQARAIETRDRILESAERAFAQFGFDAASLTRDILKPAGVSVGSFYHQFDNKSELLVALLNTRFAERHEQVTAAFPTERTNFTNDVQAAMSALLDNIDQHPDIWQIQFRERQNPDKVINTSSDVGWRLWEETTTDICEHYFEGTRSQIEHIAIATMQLLTGFLLDYLRSSADDRERLRQQLAATAQFCEAGAVVFVPRRNHS